MKPAAKHPCSYSSNWARRPGFENKIKCGTSEHVGLDPGGGSHANCRVPPRRRLLWGRRGGRAQPTCCRLTKRDSRAMRFFNRASSSASWDSAPGFDAGIFATGMETNQVVQPFPQKETFDKNSGAENKFFLLPGTVCRSFFLNDRLWRRTAP